MSPPWPFLLASLTSLTCEHDNTTGENTSPSVSHTKAVEVKQQRYKAGSRRALLSKDVHSCPFTLHWVY